MIHFHIYLIRVLFAFIPEIPKFQNLYYISEQDFNLNANLSKMKN
jgi:hypothetical protein